MQETMVTRSDALRDMLNWLLTSVTKTLVVDARPEIDEQKGVEYGVYSFTGQIELVNGVWNGRGTITCPPGWGHEGEVYPNGCTVPFQYDETLKITLG